MVPPGVRGNPYPGRTSGGRTSQGGGDREPIMARRVGVPEPEERADIPLTTPVVLRKGSGLVDKDTTYGTRKAFGVHVFDVSGESATYLGHANVFWEAVRNQLVQALTDPDMLMPCYVVRVGRRYELRNPSNPAAADKAVELVEALIGSDEYTDSAEDVPFDDIEPPAPF